MPDPIANPAKGLDPTPQSSAAWWSVPPGGSGCRCCPAPVVGSFHHFHCDRVGVSRRMCWALGVGHSRPVDRPFRHLNGSGVEVALRGGGRQTRTAGTCRSFEVAGWCHGIIHTAPPSRRCCASHGSGICWNPSIGWITKEFHCKVGIGCLASDWVCPSGTCSDKPFGFPLLGHPTRSIHPVVVCHDLATQGFFAGPQKGTGQIVSLGQRGKASS